MCGNGSQFFAPLSFSFCLHKSFTFIRAPTTTTDSFRTIDHIISVEVAQQSQDSIYTEETKRTLCSHAFEERLNSKQTFFFFPFIFLLTSLFECQKVAWWGKKVSSGTGSVSAFTEITLASSCQSINTGSCVYINPQNKLNDLLCLHICVSLNVR